MSGMRYPEEFRNEGVRDWQFGGVQGPPGWGGGGESSGASGFPECPLTSGADVQRSVISFQ